jgi:RimJ/RimL family protein N-acetyltransferase
MRVELRPWRDDDLDLLYRTVGDPAMMTHLGGPEDEEQIQRRHRMLLSVAALGEGEAFTIRTGPEATAAGTIGYWDSDWAGGDVYETGWMVVPEFAGRGLATAAAGLVIERARRAGKHRFLHAFPAVDNAASNAVCRKAGFTNLGPCEIEYPRGSMMQAICWRLDLTRA